MIDKQIPDWFPNEGDEVAFRLSLGCIGSMRVVKIGKVAIVNNEVRALMAGYTSYALVYCLESKKLSFVTGSVASDLLSGEPVRILEQTEISRLYLIQKQELWLDPNPEGAAGGKS
ncbi:hypothetical protein HQ571_02335 [Candidatus Kuenenbacteria bacterium]|nr:hypothetical protein [Candidatus Kuenenbacteria bacterium]